jgi:signal peptidase I
VSDVSNPSQTDAAESPAKNDRQELKREVLDFVKLVVWFLVIFLGLRTYVIEGYEVQGPSMQPTLENNERILVLKLPHIVSRWSWFDEFQAIEPGDIVVFDSPDSADKRYVKRVIAHGPKATKGNKVDAEIHDAPTVENVQVRFDRGTVYVNNHRVTEDYIRSEHHDSSGPQEITLGPGEYYVLGDNRRVSKDSRSFEAIEDEAIIGKAFLRFWPPSKISLLR